MHALAQDCKLILYTLPFLWIDEYVSAISDDEVPGICLGGGFFLAATTAVTVVVIAGLMILTVCPTGRSLLRRSGRVRKRAEMGITPLHA